MTIAYHQPTEFSIDQPGTLPLSFSGWQIASESSEWAPRRAHRGAKVKTTPTKPSDRWTEVRIYLTMTDRWVVEYLGCSRMPGEVTIRRIEVCDEPDEVVDALRHAGSGKIPGVSARALRAAAELDDRLTPALKDQV